MPRIPVASHHRKHVCRYQFGPLRLAPLRTPAYCQFSQDQNHEAFNCSVYQRKISGIRLCIRFVLTKPPLCMVRDYKEVRQQMRERVVNFW
jgi:hypothetical protein